MVDLYKKPFDDIENQQYNKKSLDSFDSVSCESQYKEQQYQSETTSQFYNGNSFEKRGYRRKEGYKFQRWTQEQCLLYEHFIQKYQKIMQDTTSKRNSKIFLFMSEFIGKTPTQCRSHHQKVKLFIKFYTKTINKLNLNSPSQNGAEHENILDLSNQEFHLMPNGINRNIYKTQKFDEQLQQIDISNQHRLDNQDRLLSQSTFLEKVKNESQQQINSKNTDDYMGSFLYITPFQQPVRPSECFENFSLNRNNLPDDGEVNWKKVFEQIDTVDNSFHKIVNLMENCNN